MNPRPGEKGFKVFITIGHTKYSYLARKTDFAFQVRQIKLNGRDNFTKAHCRCKSFKPLNYEKSTGFGATNNSRPLWLYIHSRINSVYLRCALCLLKNENSPSSLMRNAFQKLKAVIKMDGALF